MANILIVSNHYPVCSARFATDAFRRLGHTVRHVGPAMGANIWGMTLPPWSVWEPDELLKLGDHHSGFLWADIVIVMDSDPAILQDANSIPNPSSGLKVVWGVDNHVRDYRRGWFDHYFLAHRNVSVMGWQSATVMTTPQTGTLTADGVLVGVATSDSVDLPDITHLPCCYDPTLHTPSPISFEEREYDVCMIGVMYPQRMALVNGLRKAGLKVLAGTGLIGDAYRDAYHNSRIALNISVSGDAAQRLFETAAMGCVVMTDPVADLAILKPLGFWLLDDWEAADNTDHQIEYVIAACEDILDKPKAAIEQIALSMAWVKGHTWDTRAQTILTAMKMTGQKTAKTPTPANFMRRIVSGLRCGRIGLSLRKRDG